MSCTTEDCHKKRDGRRAYGEISAAMELFGGTA